MDGSHDLAWSQCRLEMSFSVLSHLVQQNGTALQGWHGLWHLRECQLASLCRAGRRNGACDTVSFGSLAPGQGDSRLSSAKLELCHGMASSLGELEFTTPSSLHRTATQNRMCQLIGKAEAQLANRGQ